jgi:hypothetical protein
LGLELGAVGAAAAASLGMLVVGVHVSTIFYVDTMLLDKRRHCQMGWPDAYLGSTICKAIKRQLVPNVPGLTALPSRPFGEMP